LIAPRNGRGRKYPEQHTISQVLCVQGGGVLYSMKSDDSEEGYPESAIIGLHVFKDIDDDTVTAEPERKKKKSSRPTAAEVHNGNPWDCCGQHYSGEREKCSKCMKYRDGVKPRHKMSEEGSAALSASSSKMIQDDSSNLKHINKVKAVGTFQKLLEEALANKKFHKYFRPLQPDDLHLEHGFEVDGREGLKQLCIQTWIAPAKGVSDECKHASAIRDELTKEAQGGFKLIGDDIPYVRVRRAEKYKFVFERRAGWDKAAWIQQAKKYQN